MSEEEIEFKKHCDETLKSIYSKINEEEKTFLSYLVNRFNNMCERNFAAIEYISKKMIDVDIYGEQTMNINDLLSLLKGDKE